MPCNDVTEILELTLDADDRVIDYSLNKQTCGGSVAGRGLVRDWVKGKDAAFILSLAPAQILADSDNPDPTWEYLRLKHLFSIQSALREYAGGDSDSERRRFVEILTIDFGADGARLTARLNVEVITDEIQACGRCGG